jgi:WD40 repeat protein
MRTAYTVSQPGKTLHEHHLSCTRERTRRAARTKKTVGRVISSSDDRTVRVWDLESGQEVAQWEGDAAFVARDAVVLNTGIGENRPSLVIAAGDRGGNVHVLEFRDDRETATSKP